MSGVDIFSMTVMISLFLMVAGALYAGEEWFCGVVVTICGVVMLVGTFMAVSYKETSFYCVIKVGNRYYKVISENEYKQMEIDRIKKSMEDEK